MAYSEVSLWIGLAVAKSAGLRQTLSCSRPTWVTTISDQLLLTVNSKGAY